MQKLPSDGESAYNDDSTEALVPPRGSSDRQLSWDRWSVPSGGALAIGVLDEVDIALVVSLRAEARDSHDLPLEVFAVEALGVLLPPDVGHLLTKVALIWMSAVPVVIVRAPELEIRLLGSWVVDACAFWLMQS